MQEVQVQSLVGELSSHVPGVGEAATKPMLHIWACAPKTESLCHNESSREPQQRPDAAKEKKVSESTLLAVWPRDGTSEWFSSLIHLGPWPHLGPLWDDGEVFCMLRWGSWPPTLPGTVSRRLALRGPSVRADGGCKGRHKLGTAQSLVSGQHPTTKWKAVWPSSLGRHCY